MDLYVFSQPGYEMVVSGTSSVSLCVCMCLCMYCDMRAVGQQSTVETLFITVAEQRNNGRDQRFLCGLIPACTRQSKELLFSTGSGPTQQCGSVFFGVRPRDYITRVFSEPVAVG
jgi:hypothetical protein